MRPRDRYDYWTLLRRLLAGLLLLGGIGLLWLMFDSERIDPEHPLRWLLAVRDHPAALLLVIALYVVGSALMISLYLLILATALAFGPLLGAGYSMVGMMLAAAVTYGIGHALGHDAVDRLGGTQLQRISRYLRDQSIPAIILLRVLPLCPFTLTNLVAGASHMRLRDFLAASAIGLLPALLVLSLFAGPLRDLLQREDMELGWLGVLAVVIAAGLAAAGWVYRRRLARLLEH